jgi:RimJ/RimL family protein N-acetyltransferase
VIVAENILQGRRKLTSSSLKITKVETIKAPELHELPKGLSIFDPLISHEVKEALEAEGEVYVSQESTSGENNGLFIYDNFEATGTIFTKNRTAFDYFFKLKPSSYIFSELEISEYPKELWNIWQLDVDNVSSIHRFKHQVSMEHDAEEIERFMQATQPETNMKWIRVALRNGDKCFVVRMSNRIVAMAWMSIVDGIARSHGLYVEPKFRRMGLMTDNLQARIIYLKSRHVHTLINEIAESNVASGAHAAKAGEKIVGKMFLYDSSPVEQKTKENY